MAEDGQNRILLVSKVTSVYCFGRNAVFWLERCQLFVSSDDHLYFMQHITRYLAVRSRYKNYTVVLCRYQQTFPPKTLRLWPQRIHLFSKRLHEKYLSVDTESTCDNCTFSPSVTSVFGYFPMNSSFTWLEMHEVNESTAVHWQVDQNYSFRWIKFISRFNFIVSLFTPFQLKCWNQL